MVVNNVILSLKEIGLSEYEAKAYCSLLSSNPSTAYELAKKSAIPTSKVYEVIVKLIEKKMIVEIIGKKK